MKQGQQQMRRDWRLRSGLITQLVGAYHSYHSYHKVIARILGLPPYDSGISSSAYYKTHTTFMPPRAPDYVARPKKPIKKLQSHEETQHRVAVLTMP